MNKKNPITNLIKNVSLYEACGNRLLIVHLNSDFSYDDTLLRNELKKLGLASKVDSVLVITGDPDKILQSAYHVTMDIFEPRGVDNKHSNLAGSWSAMCGNGIRVVTRYLIDHGYLSCLIKTISGLRQSRILPDNQYKVNMGKFTDRQKYLRRYIHNFDFSHIKKRLNGLIKIEEIIAGLNGDVNKSGFIDGEPHLVIFIKQQINNISDLVNYANRIGPLVTLDQTTFPEYINTNLVSIERSGYEIKRVLGCTFERGVNYVTQACGTGATVIGAYLISKTKNLYKVEVEMPGGRLVVSTNHKKSEYFLTGSANPVLC